MRKLIDRIFKLEEINGGERCPTYLYRWRLASLPWFKVYLHKFVGDDWSRDLHDHPKEFTSIGLWGRYQEHSAPDPTKPDEQVVTDYKAPWFRRFPAHHTHRIVLPKGVDVCWTLVVVGKPTRTWGFWPGGKFVPWRRYLVSERADHMKSCGDD